MLIPVNRRTDETRKIVEMLVARMIPASMSDQRRIEVLNADDSDEATVLIYDYIGWPYNDPVDFAHQVMAIQKPVINVRIHSPGGNVYDGIDMMNTLRMHPANVIVHITGMAASAATIVALGANEVRMVKGTRFMIHNASLITWGNADQVQEDVDFLRQVDGDIRGIYQRKTGQPESKIAAWMKATTYFSAEDAEKYGFIDTVVDGTPEKTAFNLSEAYRRSPEDSITQPEEPPGSPAAPVGGARNTRMLALMERMGK